jgi:hypothetical protein
LRDEDVPLWRWLAVGGIFTVAAGYFLYTGQIPVNKARTVFITRAGDPLAYWIMVLVPGILGPAALYKAWKKLTSP